MQPTPPQTPTAPPDQPARPLSITTVGPDGKTQTLPIPKTRTEVQELLVQRQELGDQLANVTSRRRDVAEEVRATTDATTRAGLEDRLRLLDQRILQLETDIAVTGRQLAAAPAEVVASTESRNTPSDPWGNGRLEVGFFVLVFSVFTFLYARLRRRRRIRGAPSQLPIESNQRLERLEQGMEAIAIEIERISEGQRFVTKLLSEQAPVGAANRIAQGAPAEQQGTVQR